MQPTKSEDLLAQHFAVGFSQTYATSVLVLIKPGKMSSNVPTKDLRNCAVAYTLPQLDIVKPGIALCLGAKAFNSVRSGLGLSPLRLQEACIPSGPTRMGRTELYGVPHTGSWGTRNAGGHLAVEGIWADLARRFHTLVGCAQQSGRQIDLDRVV